MITIYKPSKPCVKNDPAGYAFTLSLTSQADTKLFQDNPTLDVSDFVIIGDGVNHGVIDSVPVAVATATRAIRVTLSQDEINHDSVEILCHDASGTQWCDILVILNMQAAVSVSDFDETADVVAHVTLTDTVTTVTNNVGLADDGITAAKIAAGAIGVLEAPLLANLDATITSRLPTTSYVTPPTTTQIDTLLSTNHGAGTWDDSGSGTGAITFTYTVLDGVTPIENARVIVTTDIAGVNQTAVGYTTASGEVIFHLDAGTYYFWVSKSGYSFTSPDTEVVSL